MKDSEQYFTHRFTPRTFTEDECKEYERKISEYFNNSVRGCLIVPDYISEPSEEDDYLG